MPECEETILAVKRKSSNSALLAFQLIVPIQSFIDIDIVREKGICFEMTNPEDMQFAFRKGEM